MYKSFRSTKNKNDYYAGSIKLLILWDKLY
jgi:hypothetical protein